MSWGGNRGLYRQFKDWDGNGGRLYGHWVQSLPKWVRDTLTIDGKPVVELDYASMQLRLLYHLAGVCTPNVDDLYQMDVMTANREDMKRVLTLSVGNATREDTLKSLRYDLHQQSRTSTSAERLYDQFWASHIAVCPHSYGSDQAVATKLQNLDSQIALRVLRIEVRLHQLCIVQGSL